MVSVGPNICAIFNISENDPTRPLHSIGCYVVLGQMPFLGLERPNTSACHIPNVFFHELSEHRRHISRSFSSSETMLPGS